MAFKSLNSYNEEKYGDFFILKNDKDYADVVFLYQSVNDVVVADVHYIKSSGFSGYVQCCEHGCPACEKGIRVQTKLFIPVYNIAKNKIEFWDRTMKFEPQLQQDVFANFPNPSEYVFRITRNGAAGDINTTYAITVLAKNTDMPYSLILANNQMTLPEGYNLICKDLTSAELATKINATAASAPTESYNYTPTPRVTPSSPIPDATFSAPPAFTEDENVEGDDSDDSLSDVDF